MKDVINYPNESDAASGGRPSGLRSSKTLLNIELHDSAGREACLPSFDAFPNKIRTFVAMKVNIDPSWGEHLQAEFDAPYFKQLTDFVRAEYAQGPCYPPGHEIFNAFNLCPFDKVKVVIIGQDPYHGPGQAEGLCFSVKDGVRIPPSLVNIFKEINADTGRPIPSSGSLRRWAEQGVLLLNATLTVRQHQAASHAGHGWETFTDAVIRHLSSERDHLVFILGAVTRRRKDK